MKVMGIVNITPDSFSDGGKYYRPEEAVRRVHNLVDEGADIIDLGAESTRPEAIPLAWQEEWERLEPVLKQLGSLPVPLSVDTYHAETAARAIAAGARLVNCVKSEYAEAMIALATQNESLELVLPVSAFDRCPETLRDRCYLDPMIGFGTTREADVALLRSIRELSQRGRVLVGASRKRVVKKLTGENVTGKNLAGNLAIAVWCALNGASVIRVHDVAETIQALKVIKVLTNKRSAVKVNAHSLGVF